MKTKTQTNNNMKSLLSFFMLSFFANSLFAQTTLPTNRATGKVTYRFTIPVNGNVSNEEAYEMASNWFGSHTKECTRSNVSVATENMSGVNKSNLAEVEHEFKNTAPVQSLDPSSNRMTIKVVTKYFGENGGTIHALYVQGYMIVTVENHQITCEVSDFRYNHFNERSFQFKRIQNWGNSTSLDPVAPLEYIVENEQSHAEFGKFYSFLNKDLNRMVENFSIAVKATEALASN
jgi:hypothetical protein